MDNGKRVWAAAGGVLVGIINGLLGAGGGMLAVPLLSLLGVEGKKSHATSLAIIVPLSAVSAAVYLAGGRFALSDALIYLPGGIIGAVAGGLLLPRISVGWIKIAFAGLLLWGGIRLVTP